MNRSSPHRTPSGLRWGRSAALLVAWQMLALCFGAAEADVYRWVPLPRSTLPSEVTDGATPREQSVTLNGTRFKVRYWQPRSTMTEIRGAMRRTLVSEYAAWQHARRRDARFDADRSAYWALPRVVLNPTWLAMVRFRSDGSGSPTIVAGRRLPVPPVQISDVTLVLPANDPQTAMVLTFSVPTETGLSLFLSKGDSDAPGRDHERAGRPVGSTRVFSLEETHAGVRQFTASYVMASSPVEAVNAMAANLERRGFKIVTRSAQPDVLRIEMQDHATVLTLFGSTSTDSGVTGRVIVSATDGTLQPIR